MFVHVQSTRHNKYVLSVLPSNAHEWQQAVVQTFSLICNNFGKCWYAAGRLAKKASVLTYCASEIERGAHIHIRRTATARKTCQKTARQWNAQRTQKQRKRNTQRRFHAPRTMHMRQRTHGWQTTIETRMQNPSHCHRSMYTDKANCMYRKALQWETAARMQPTMHDNRRSTAM